MERLDPRGRGLGAILGQARGMNDLDAYRSYFSWLYGMTPGVEHLWNVSEVPRWCVKQRQRARLVAGFVKKVRAAFIEAERRWPA